MFWISFFVIRLISCSYVVFVHFVPLAGISEVLASLNLGRTATYGLQQQRFCSLRSSAPVLIFSLLFSQMYMLEHCAAQFYVVLRISINV